MHWSIELDSDSAVSAVQVTPVLDALQETRNASSLSLDQFAQAFAEAALGGEPRVTEEDYQIYLSLMARCSGYLQPRSSRLLISANSDGGVRYVELSEITQLSLSHREYLGQMVVQA